MFEPITCYRCKECRRIYETKPDSCACEKSIFLKGKQYGPFIILGRSEKQGHILTRCILCGGRKEILYTNIKRQTSCGCKPRYVSILSIEPECIRYKCTRCKNVRIAAPPIAQYCCEEMGDELCDTD